eukprot:1078743-Amphidinium_carterae.1
MIVHSWSVVLYEGCLSNEAGLDLCWSSVPIGETVQKELVELSTSMQQTVSASGPAALMEPSVKFRHDQLLAELALLEKRAQDECSEASELVRRLLDHLHAQGMWLMHTI